jgi:dolichol-phosphate mannosyltransferase
VTSTVSASDVGWVNHAEPTVGTLVLSVVVPSFNERENVAPLVARLSSALTGIEWEVVYVDDDSPDGTAAAVRGIARRDRRVRCIQRVRRRGLSSAVIEGVLATSADYIAVIDADMQHDETLLPRMLDTIRGGGLDVVVGSRFVGDGGTGDWQRSRLAISRVAARMARFVVHQPLSDPMSGFFVITRAAFEKSTGRLSGQGFKILLDILASAPTPLRVAEVPYTFRARQHGESKLDTLVAWEYLMLLLDKRIGRIIPVRFASFIAVGATGVVVHLAVLRALLVSLPFAQAQLLASITAMVSNFLINNVLTYRDQRLRGPALVRGLVTFVAICSVGAIANIRFAVAAFERDYSWWISGVAGAIVGAVWNYAVSSVFTWGRKV